MEQTKSRKKKTKNRRMNNYSKKGRDLSQRMMDDLFTAQQKQTLEFTQGKIKLTIKDQLDNRFGNRLS